MQETNKKIPVFLSSDNNFSPFVATTIASIMENTKSFVDFYILDGGIHKNNREGIRNTAKKYERCTVEFLEIDTEKEFKGFPTRVHFSVDMYTRYLIPQLKPGLDRVIYSDVDVIFNFDIKNLFEEDLQGKTIGAVPFMFGYMNPDKRQIEEFHDRLGLAKSHKYFESGLLLIDCEKWRREKVTDRLMKEVKESSPERLLTPDQDVLNIVFKNNYRELDQGYIVVPSRAGLLFSRDETRDSVLSPKIIHFAGPEKPWDFPEINYAEYFWKYARKTCFHKKLRHNLALRIRNKNAAERGEYAKGSLKKKTSRLFHKIRVIATRTWCRLIDSYPGKRIKNLKVVRACFRR